MLSRYLKYFYTSKRATYVGRTFATLKGDDKQKKTINHCKINTFIIPLKTKDLLIIIHIK